MEEKSTTLEELYAYLKRFSLSDSLFVIGVINAALRYGFKEVQTDGIPAPTLRWLEIVCKKNIDRVSLSLHLTRLARFLILSGTNDYKEPILDTGSLELEKALFLISTLFDREAEGDIKTSQDASRVFGRLVQWQFPLQTNRPTVIGRAQLLFIELSREVSATYDVEQKMREYYGVGAFEFIASGIALWIMSTGVLKHNLTIEVDALKSIVTTESIRRFVELSTGTPEDYRRGVRGEQWKEKNKLFDIYGLDPFLYMPAIKTTRTLRLEPNCYIVPQPFYLLQRSSLGIFYLLADHERKLSEAIDKKGRNLFRDTFGDVYRKYIAKNLDQATGPTTFIDLDSDLEGIPDGIKIPDFAIVNEEIAILFEVKISPFSATSRTILNEESIKVDIERNPGSYRKAMDQLTSFETALKSKAITDKRFKNVTKIIKILVCFEDIFLANSLFLPLTRELYGNETADNLQIVGISDVETIGAKLSSDQALASLLWEKVTDPGLAEWGVGPFLTEKGAMKESPVLQKAYEDIMSRMAGKGNLPI